MCCILLCAKVALANSVWLLPTAYFLPPKTNVRAIKYRVSKKQEEGGKEGREEGEYDFCFRFSRKQPAERLNPLISDTEK